MPEIEVLHAWIDAHEGDLVRDLQAMLAIDSVESAAEPNAPYGSGNRRALDLALKLSQDAGMKTTDLEGHFGFADFGSGDRLVMAIGHLDVVPVGNGWTKAPFGAEIDGGYLYARGATDDKGPSIAVFYAMRAIKESFPELPSRFRMGFGCDEESGFGCIERYVQTEEAPTFGIAPDSGWPCYNAEKGICDLRVTITTPVSPIRLVALRGGSRPNIVIDECTATVEVESSHRKSVEDALARWHDRNLTASWEGTTLKLDALGKAAHGSTPFMGDSAAVKIFRFLLAIATVETQEFYEALLVSAHPAGEGLGIHGLDPVTGLLSCNLGIADGENGELSLLFNIRYNVDTDAESLMKRAEAKLIGKASSVEIDGDSRPLYFDAEHPLVKTVVEVYQQESGEFKAPGSMGGGTYARAIPNTVSIGTSWPGDGDAHGPDERIAISSVLKATKIYAHILYRLATLPDQPA